MIKRKRTIFYILYIVGFFLTLADPYVWFPYLVFVTPFLGLAYILGFRKDVRIRKIALTLDKR